MASAKDALLQVGEPAAEWLRPRDGVLAPSWQKVQPWLKTQCIPAIAITKKELLSNPT